MITTRLEQNDFDSICDRLNDLIVQPSKPIVSTSTRDINHILRQQKSSQTTIEAPFKLVNCIRPCGRPKGTAASSVSYHPSKQKVQNVIKRKAANIFNLAKCLTTKKPKIIIETTETTQTIKTTTTVKTKTTSSTKNSKLAIHTSDTSEDASVLEVQEINTSHSSIAPSLLRPTSLQTNFFQEIKTSKIKNKQRLSSSDVFNFQQLLRYQFPLINGLVLCPNSCLDPRPFNNSIFVHLLDYNEPDGRNHWVLLTNIGKIDCWSVYDSLGIASKEYKSFFKSFLHNEQQVTIEKPSCTKQKESWTCGLFCLAFATALCMGYDPSKYTFDENTLVKCYNDCLANLNISMFPITEKKTTRSKQTKRELLYLA